MFRVSLLAAVLLAALPAAGFAQGSDQQKAQEKACGSDVRKICRKAMEQGDEAIQKCLQENVAKLSQQCRRVLQESK